MAQETKRGPGRPPGSKNKKKNTGSKSSSKSSTSSASSSAASAESLKRKRIAEMQAKMDKDRKTMDVIWGITICAVGVFLLFTVVMDTTGAFGEKVHDVCLGLFGLMAYVLPFFFIIAGILLIAQKLQHISGRTAICGTLIFLNLCILNSYRFIEPDKIAYSFTDIGNYYHDAIDDFLSSGGAIGMLIGNLLVKFFGKPGLVIIAVAVLLISIFLVANTPISKMFEEWGRKREQKKLLREFEAAETAKVQMAVASAARPTAEDYAAALAETSARTSAAQASSARAVDVQDTYVMTPAEHQSFWKSMKNGITKVSESVSQAVGVNTEIAPPMSVDELHKTSKQDSGDSAASVSSTQNAVSENKSVDDKGDSVIQMVKRDTLFGRIAKRFSGNGWESGDVTGDEDYGYPGRRTSAADSKSSAAASSEDTDKRSLPTGLWDEEEKPAKRKSYGLGDPDEVGHSGSYGLNGTSSTRASAGTGLDPGMPGGTALSAGLAATNTEGKRERKSRVSKQPQTADTTQKKQIPEVSEKELAAVDKELSDGFNADTEDSGYVLPPIDLLKKSTVSKQIMTDYQLEEKADLLEKTLNDFGVDAKVLNVTQGASVTRYEVQPATGVKVSSITRLADDIALNLRAKTIRIEAPIPGKAAVGIEVENEKPSPVFIRDLIDSDEFRDSKSKITFVVGKDISGNNVVADLKDMPHMLIAGATGSGKSVCINTIIASFLYKAKPSELKLIMVDPKVVELAHYNGIPHMLTPVVTDPKKAARALSIAVKEMDDRYELFAKEGVRDLESYNEHMRIHGEPQKCKPQVVIIIDELADLMMAASSEVENSICRLAQKARAAGMHLIVATQRPSVDVVTGLIKANIPSRIAFSVSSQFDSRTILDMAGAEKLLGKGDMLFSPVGANKPIRVQGPFISDSETEKLIKFVKKEGGDPVYDEDLKNAIERDEKTGGGEPQDDLTEDAIEFILKQKQASVSMLQRRFRIGYNRAARIIDEIEERGIIGPSDGSRPRQVLMTEDEYFGSMSGEPEQAAEHEPMQEPSPEPEPEPEQPVVDVEAEQVSTGDSGVDAFNSLPESVRRMVMNTDGDSEY